MFAIKTPYKGYMTFSPFSFLIAPVNRFGVNTDRKDGCKSYNGIEILPYADEGQVF